MKLITFNVNGVRSMHTKSKNGEKSGLNSKSVLVTLVEDEKPDILCLQEIKTQAIADLGTLKEIFKYSYVNCAKKKGYSGVALLCNEEPIEVSYGFEKISVDELYHESGVIYTEYAFIDEGRVITAEFNNYIVVTCYTPNSKTELERLEERMIWEDVFRGYLKLVGFETSKPIIVCGDLNVAPQEMDIHDPKRNKRSAGFTVEEREKMNRLLDSGFVDSFRALHPDDVQYSYWSNFAQARQKNKGWRIDFILCSTDVGDKIVESGYLKDYCGSDHCPHFTVFDME